MFTGITSHQIKILEKQDDGNLTFVLTLPKKTKLNIGASVLLRGICSTVVNCLARSFSVVYMPETRKKTTVNAWAVGDSIHFEESLRVGDSVDGHFVFGHIDTTAVVRNTREQKSAYDLFFSLASKWMPFIVPKGSIAVDGVSLTIVSVGKNTFSVSLIPHTRTKTHLGTLQKGDRVNIEIDMLARYVLKMQNSKCKMKS